MKHSSTLFLIFVLTTSSVVAQPDSLWSRTYGGELSDVWRRMHVLNDGSLIIGGNSNSHGDGNRSFWLTKLSSDGDSLWSYFYGGEQAEWGAEVIPTSDGGFAMTGSSSSFGPGDADYWLLKVDENGDSLWSRAYGGPDRESTRSLNQTVDGGYLIAGWTLSFGAGTEDMWLVRTDQNGDSLWSRTFGGESNDRCFYATYGIDGNIYSIGDTRSYGQGDKDIWLVAADDNGDSLWSQTFNGGYDDDCRWIQQLADSGFVLVGSKNMDNADNWDVWIIRTDSQSEVLWERTYGGPLSEGGEHAAILPDGGIVVVGYTYSFGVGDRDFWLLRVNAEGDSLWSRTFGSVYSDRGWGMAIAEDSGYYLCGVTDPEGVDEANGWIVRTGPDPVEHPPEEFSRVYPEDSTIVESMMVAFAWTRAVDLDGDEVIYLLHVESATYPFPDPAYYTTTDTTIIVEIPWPTDALDDIHEFTWSVQATAEGDTVDASNGEGVFYMEIPDDADQYWELPTEYTLSVYPNPFNPSITILYDVPHISQVRITIYDLMGREVAQLVNRPMNAGCYQVNWECSSCATGLYMVELRGESHRQITKAMLLR